MSPQDPQNAALLAHIVSQIEQNVNFLADQNYISNGDASAILTRLPNVRQGTSGINGLASHVANLGIGNRNMPPPAIPRQIPAPPTLAQSRALWGYNENGQVFPTTLSLLAITLRSTLGPRRSIVRCRRYNRNRRRNQR